MLYLATHVKNLDKANELKDRFKNNRKLRGEPELYLKKQLHDHKYLRSTWIIVIALEGSSNGIQNNIR